MKYSKESPYPNQDRLKIVMTITDNELESLAAFYQIDGRDHWQSIVEYTVFKGVARCGEHGLPCGKDLDTHLQQLSLMHTTGFLFKKLLKYTTALKEKKMNFEHSPEFMVLVSNLIDLDIKLMKQSA